jgi:hypothetical protein
MKTGAEVERTISAHKTGRKLSEDGKPDKIFAKK